MTRRRGLWASLGGNLVLAAALVYAALPDRRGPDLTEQHVAGDRLAADKIAVVRVSGGLLEGTSGFAFAQIERAARDPAVKAVVVRVESPGGTVTAADRLHQAFEQLRDNTHARFQGTGPKPLTASFGSVAASGGYYLAMPCAKVYAEPTCITGSIGVFAALPNVAELANRNGVKLIVIKAGDIKAGGSPLAVLSPADRQPWQSLVDHAYSRFLDVVVAGRPGLTRAMMTEPVYRHVSQLYDERGNPAGVGPEVSRNRADGGTFTPPQAVELGLIDGVADLPTVAKLAAESARLTRWRAVRYEEPPSWAEWATGVKLRAPADPVGVAMKLSEPRLMMVAPGFEVAVLAGE